MVSVRPRLSNQRCWHFHFHHGYVSCIKLQVLFPSPTCKTCWAHATPLVSVHHPVLLLLTPPTEVTTMEYFCHSVRLLETCEVTRHSVLLDAERAHRRCVVLFQCIDDQFCVSSSRKSRAWSRTLQKARCVSCFFFFFSSRSMIHSAMPDWRAPTP